MKYAWTYYEEGIFTRFELVAGWHTGRYMILSLEIVFACKVSMLCVSAPGAIMTTHMN